jgi:hypothetical protein
MAACAQPPGMLAATITGRADARLRASTGPTAPIPSWLPFWPSMATRAVGLGSNIAQDAIDRDSVVPIVEPLDYDCSLACFAVSVR